MTPFSAMDIGRTGVGMAHHWIDKIAHNIANANTVTATDQEPFRQATSLVQPNQGGPFADSGSGVHTAARVVDESDPDLVFDPNHPLADEDGYVQAPVVDMGKQMVDMMIAQRHYQSNLRTVSNAHEAYQASLRLGRQ